MPKVTIKDSNEVFYDLSRPVVFTDDNSYEYRISFPKDRGIIINKISDDGSSEQIVIHPKVTNEIHIF